MKKIKKIILTLLIAVLVVGAVLFFAFYFLTTKVSDNSEKKEIVVTEGMTTGEIATLLEEEHLIKNETVFKILIRLKKVDNIYAAKYELSENMSTYEIIEALEAGGVNENTISITFREGINMRAVASIIAENTTNTEDEVYAVLKNEEYLNSCISKYWFITDEIKNPEIYYSLEGYLYPDTYQFASSSVTVEEIFDTMLDKMETELNEYRTDIESQSYSVHSLLTLASLTELEGTSLESRKGIAGVFYNRLNEGMSLGSDVTTYYAFRIDMGERDLLLSEINTANPYNTRGPGMEGKLPVGPIACVSDSAIDAAIHPSSTDDLFFVADKNGDVYFTKTVSEHDAIIEQLQNEGLWYEW